MAKREIEFISCIVALGLSTAFGGTTVVNGGTTFRWNDADGEVTGDFTNAVDAATYNQAAVYDIGKNLTINGKMSSDYGAFVKTGSGTLTVNGRFLLGQQFSNSYKDTIGNAMLTFSGDGESVTAGYGLVATIADGAFVLTNASNSVESKFGQVNSDGVIVGCWTAANGGQEKDVLFEVAGGKVSSSSTTLVGRQHGFVNNTAEGRPAKAILRISGGSYTQGGGKPFQLGGTAASPSGMGGYNAAVRFELLSGAYGHGSSNAGFLVPQYPGQDTAIFMSGGTFEDRVFKTGAYADGNYENSSPSPFLFDVCSNGVVKIEAFTNNDKNKVGPTAKIYVHDGGTFLCDNVVNNANGVLDVVVDGGIYGTACIWANFKVTHKEILPSSVTSFQIGKNGATLSARGYDASVSGYMTAYLEKGLEPAADLGEGESDGGVTISSQYDENVVDLGGVSTYAGPTRIEKGWLTLTGAGALPSASPVTVSGGGLLVTNKDFVAGSLAFDGAVALKFVPGRRVSAATAFSATAATVVTLSFTDADGADATEAVSRQAVLTVPIADKASLEGLSFGLASGNLRLASVEVEEDAGGGTATLYVSAAPATETGASSMVFATGFGGTTISAAGYGLDETSISATGYAPGEYVVAHYLKGDASMIAALPTIEKLWKSAVYSEALVADGEWAGYTKITLTIADAEARTAVWDGGAGGDTSAANEANWQDDVAPAFAAAPYTATFANGGDTATFTGKVPLLGLQFASSGGFTLAKGGENSSLLVSTGGIDVAEWSEARKYTVAVPTEFSGAQTWTIPANQTLAFNDAMTGSDGTIALKGKNGALEFHGTNVIGGAMVVTGHTVFVTGLLDTPGHENQGAASKNGANTLVIDTNGSGAMKGLTVSNAVVEKPLYFHCKSGYGFIKAPAGTTNVIKGNVTWDSPWIGTTVAEDAELVFEGGLRTGWSMRSNGEGVVRIRNTPVTATESVGWNVSAGKLAIDVAGNTFSYLTTGYENGGAGIVELSVSDALTTNSVGGLGIGVGYWNGRFRPFTSGDSALLLHSTTQTVNILVGSQFGTVRGDAGARIEVMKQEPNSVWPEDMLYFASKVEGDVTLAMKGTGTLLMTNQAFASTGDIEVEAGEIRFAEDATWLNGTDVKVGGSGRLSVARYGTFDSRSAELSLSDEGVMEVPKGTLQTFAAITTNGIPLPVGRYVSLPNGDGGDFLTGGGAIAVRRRG